MSLASTTKSLLPWQTIILTKLNSKTLTQDCDSREMSGLCMYLFFRKQTDGCHWRESSLVGMLQNDPRGKGPGLSVRGRLYFIFIYKIRANVCVCV